jgi:hypothetical protein
LTIQLLDYFGGKIWDPIVAIKGAFMHDNK